MNKKQIITIWIAAFIVMLSSAIWWLTSPLWVDLYFGELLSQDKQSIVEVLSKAQIEYKYDESSKKLLVQKEDLAKARKALVDNGIPQKNGMGLEFFANSDYGLSEFVQNINYQRGMEEELSRTIRTMNGVKNVRVHLTTKKASLFDDKKQESKASVVIEMHENASLDKSQVRGIQELVATAISGLQADSVIVLSENGKIVSSTTQSTYIEDTNNVEIKYTRIVSDLLASYLGNYQFNVAVNVVVDRRKKVTVEENYLPDVRTGKGFISKSKNSDKKGESANSQLGSEEVLKDEEFIYSKERSEISYPSGEITRVSLGVVIQKNLSPEDQLSLKDLISKSIGLDIQRGDTLSLVVSKATDYKKSPEDIHEQTETSSTNVVVKTQDVFSLPYIKIFLLVLLFSIVLSVYLAIKLIFSRKNRAPQLSPEQRDQLIAEIQQWIK